MYHFFDLALFPWPLGPLSPRIASRSLQGAPRCSLDASQIVPRCFPASPRTASRSFQEVPTCFPNAFEATCLLVDLSIFLLVYVSTCLLVYLSTCLIFYLSACLLVYLPTCLLAYFVLVYFLLFTCFLASKQVNR